MHICMYIYIYTYAFTLHYITFTFNHLADAYMYVCMYIYIYMCVRLHYITFTFNHLADAFIQSDCQMRIIEAIKPTKEQQYVSAVTSPVLSVVVHKKIKRIKYIENK